MSDGEGIASGASDAELTDVEAEAEIDSGVPKKRQRVDGSPALHWVFTLNNPKVDEIKAIEEYSSSAFGRVLWLAYSREVGDSGTPHLQGVVSFKSKVRLAGVKMIPGMDRAHAEIRRGTVQQAVDYILKGPPVLQKPHFEGGTRPIDPKKEGGKPLQKLIAAIKAGAGVYDMWQDDEINPTLYRSLKSAEAFITLENQMKARVAPVVRYYWGESGAGKSYRAEAEAKSWCEERKLDADLHVYRHPGGQWMDGYVNQKVLLIDDWEINSSFGFRHALKMLDVYKYQVQKKGGSAWLQAELIIITSSKCIENFDEGGQFRRRVATYAEMKKADRPDIKLDAAVFELSSKENAAMFRNAATKSAGIDFDDGGYECRCGRWFVHGNGHDDCDCAAAMMAEGGQGDCRH